MQKEYLKIVLGEAYFAHPQVLEAVLPHFSSIESTSTPAIECAVGAPSIKIEVSKVAVPISLESIREDIGDCTRCKLSSTRTQIVFGKGSPNASILFVGEGPGEQEDLQGLPFVGKAGQLLDKIIQAMGLSLEQVYIANVVKCRPPGNRTPEPDEVGSCGGFLERQIRVIQPKILVALGSSSLNYLVADAAKITKSRGIFMNYKISSTQTIPLMPTFHPSYLLRNPEAKKEVWADMKLVLEKLKLA